MLVAPLGSLELPLESIVRVWAIIIGNGTFGGARLWCVGLFCELRRCGSPGPKGGTWGTRFRGLILEGDTRL